MTTKTGGDDLSSRLPRRNLHLAIDQLEMPYVTKIKWCYFTNVFGNSPYTDAKSTMNDHVFVIRADKNLHERIRRLAYHANTSRSAAIRKLLSSQDEDAQLTVLVG